MTKPINNPSDEIREKILEKALIHVPFDGWTKKSLKTAVSDLDLPNGAEELYFPGGALELIRFWAENSNIRALNQIIEQDMVGLRIRQKITECVWISIQQLEGQEEAARRAISRLSLPDAVGQGPKLLWRTSDMIWRAIGDTSTDGNYYSKRTILSGVIGSSMMAWMSDHSEKKAKARAFLDARIDNVMQFEKLKTKVKQNSAALPDPVKLISRLRYGRRRRRRY